MKQDEDSEWEVVDEIPNREPPKAKPPAEKKVGINPNAFKIVAGVAVLVFLLVITKGRIHSLWWFYLAIGVWWLYRRQAAARKK